MNHLCRVSIVIYLLYHLLLLESSSDLRRTTQIIMSISWGTQYAKLKTNLRLAINRLKLVEKKKTEMALKSRKEIADFIIGELLLENMYMI